MIEHKSSVDYDIAMQLLLYMSVIWRDYAKEKNKEKSEANKRKQFRYPLIFPIVYYEGTDQWTAGMRLSDRIANAELAAEFIPDFTYKLIPLRDYSNNDIKKNHDEMSLLMMINKIQGPQDFEEFKRTAEEFARTIYNNTSPDIQDLIMKVIWGLLMKMKMPEDEAVDMLNNVREGKDMGILFENFKGIDIQAQRDELRKVKEEADEAKKEADEAKKEADKAKKEADEAKRETEEIRSGVLDSQINYMNQCKAEGKNRQQAIQCLMNIFSLTTKEASGIIEAHWE